MKSLKDKKDLIISFWDIESENDREKLLSEIKQYSESKSEEEVASEIRNNFNQFASSGIEVLYEALSQNPKKWSEFFKEEYKRAFRSAENSDNPLEILDSLEGISFVDEGMLNSRVGIIKLLENYLSHENDIIRFKSIWYLRDWIFPDEENRYLYLIQKIAQRLEDGNWKIRYVAQMVLKDMNKLPKNFNFRLMDKIRVKLFNPLEIK